MDDWTDGYVADLEYTHGYYSELNPQRVALAFLNAGLAVPALRNACELGFGQGLSINLHAAAGGAQWWGTDFNPSQAAFARELGSHGGNPALFDHAFDEFCARTDLPEFDYIGLHGIWSWVSDDNRRVIADFIRRKLKVGGVVYVSYNTMPGWSAMAPLRGLLTAHSEQMGAPGMGRVQRIEAALEFADRLLAAKPGYALANPGVAERLKQLKAQNRNYLAHEYFNRDWAPMSFEQMAGWLESAKLGFACSANLLDHVEQINLTAQQRELLRGIPDPAFRQTVRDFCVNQQFRKDYWVRGARRLSPGEQAEALRALSFVLAQPRADVPLKVQGSLGAAAMQESVYAPVLDAFGDQAPHTLGDIHDRLGSGGITLAQLTEAVILLVGNGSLFPAQDEAGIARARPAAQRINAWLCSRARNAAEVQYLASPVTGGGVHVPRFSQLFLAAARDGNPAPAELARQVWRTLAAQNQRIVKDGQALESETANVAELESQARTFVESQLPVLRALGIA
ncbi:class I SAM-dependent methyltransferase [Ramlibacter tataouinensis]|uniref:class I SAM-dependent methyltransferase n=1 Tax=Ramlibacter tataouinensis TaxID=94132 RepID=UPI0022F3B95A|nr:class I SAM-dependent methyltransferase [Ramlibacter tataouinensis]WBY03345.1 class I SAM-dependent methyltransferase [Ramlibacter tataouinensis]